jgi:hypothetical protein
VSFLLGVCLSGESLVAHFLPGARASGLLLRATREYFDLFAEVADLS